MSPKEPLDLKCTPRRYAARRAALITATVAASAALFAVAASATPPQGEITEPTWIRDRVGAFWADFDAATASAARYSMFVVGPQDPANPQEPEHEEPDGSIGPAHDHVLPNIPYGRRATCHVWAVLAAPGAPAGAVLVRADSSFAYAIDLGGGLVPLTDYERIEEGLAAGLLTLSDRGFPDFTCWTERRR